MLACWENCLVTCMPCPLVSSRSTLPMTKLSTEPLFSLTSVLVFDDEEEPGSMFTYDSFERDESCWDFSGVFIEPRLQTLRMLWTRLESDALPTTTRRVGRHAAMTAMPPSIKDQ